MTEKGSRHRPWFPFYAQDFMGTVRTWSAEEIGAYILLLGEQWINGEIPTGEKQLARIHPDIPAHWKTKLQRKFPDGKNARLEEIRTETQNKIQARSDAGRTAANARWERVDNSPDSDNANASSDALPTHMQTHSDRIAKSDANAMLPTPTPIPKEITKPKSKNKSLVSDAMWKKFCDLFPKRNGPDPNKSARQKAERCLKTGANWADIMKGLRRYRKHCDDSNIESQFIMRKETFLNPEKEFWNSEYAETETGSAGVGAGNSEDTLLSMASILGIDRKPNEQDDAYRDRLGKANARRIAALAHA